MQPKVFISDIAHKQKRYQDLIMNEVWPKKKKPTAQMNTHM